MTLLLGSPTRRTIATIAVISLLGTTACGSDGDAGSVDPSVPEDPGELDLDELRTALDSVEFESEAVPAGPLLGDEPLAADVETDNEFEATADSEGSDRDPEFDDCAEIDDCGDDEVDLGEDALEPAPFRPAPEWAAFCTVLAEIEEREFPTEPYEALRVVDLWFGLLEPHVPQQIAADFGLLDRLLDDAVAVRDVTLLESSPPEVDAAGDRIGDAVDTECAGR